MAGLVRPDLVDDIDHPGHLANHSFEGRGESLISLTKEAGGTVPTAEEAAQADKAPAPAKR